MTAPTLEKNLRILVIDDTRAIHDDFRKILAGPKDTPDFDAIEADLFGGHDPVSPAARFQLDSAYQGQEGFELIKRAAVEGRPYAMAFVDMRMPPGWDGIETIEQIWKYDADMQIVVCSAYSDYSWSEMLQKLGNSDRLVILKKPFGNAQVLQLASSLCEQWRSRHE
jgi:CheY-like chemotaxis protein